MKQKQKKNETFQKQHAINTPLVCTVLADKTINFKNVTTNTAINRKKKERNASAEATLGDVSPIRHLQS